MKWDDFKTNPLYDAKVDAENGMKPTCSYHGGL